jgi:hypothetical protein
MRSTTFKHVLALLITLTASMTQAETPVNTQVLTSPVHQTSMLELYTSQGCSSCPPAERWISTLADDPQVWKEIIPINFRVDYWDYLGWKDHYADPKFSHRQRLYQHLGHSRTVATPGFMVNGKSWYGWFYKKPIKAERIDNAGVLKVSIQNGKPPKQQATIKFTPGSPIKTPLTAHLVVMGFGLEDYISRGENKGETFVQDFVVLGHKVQPLDIKNDSGNTNITLPDVSSYEAKRLAVAVWISDALDPSPIQAVADWLE